MSEDPGKTKVENLLQAVHEGDYVIPYFQRGYEWEPTMVSDLIISILQDYYAGLLLFWELDADKSEKQVWDPVWGAKRGNHPTKAILDGQQRLSSLYYAIYNPKKKFPNRKTYYRWYLNLDKCLNEEYGEAVDYRYSFYHRSIASLKQRRDEWIEKGVIPLAILSDSKYLTTSEFELWIQDYVRDRKERGIIPDNVTSFGVSNVVRGILEYQFIVTTLSRERDVHDICNIFARINQKGMRLSTFDLMNAFLYPHGIELRKWWEALDNPKLEAVDRNMNEYLLKLISLYLQGYCSSKYIYNLIPGQETKKRLPSGKMEDVVLVKDQDDFTRLWEQACRYAEKAREVIMNVGHRDFGAIKSKFIPNTTIVPVLGAVLWKYEQRQPKVTDFRAHLSRWYWSAVFSGDYSGSSDTIMAKDFRDWERWLEEGREVGRASRVDEDFIRNELDLTRVKRGSQYNAVLCMLALNNARDFFTGRPLATGDYIEERINDHHIFPVKVKGLPLETSREFKTCRDSILNRTLLLDQTNKHEISNDKPSVYLKRLMEQEGMNDRGQLEELMEAHFISSEALDCLFRDDFDGFIEEREKTIKAHILAHVSQ